MKKQTASAFFKAWKETVNESKSELWPIWRENKQLTHKILSCDDSIIKKVAAKLGLEHYLEYYYIDAVLFVKDKDETPDLPKNLQWLRDIRIAFEHENFFDSGLYQEVSHLLTTNCDVRVLVTYPENSKGEKDERALLHKIIQGTRQSKALSDSNSFLIIFGYEADFSWKGLIYKEDDWIECEPIA